MLHRPIISILMPSFNDAKYISDSIRSVQEQKFEDWELIIVDNGSTDETAQIVEKMKESRIKYLREERPGQLNALFLGSYHIIGEYVTILHSDDELKDRFSILNNLKAMEELKCDGVFGNLIKINGDGKETGIIKTVNDANLASSALVLLTGGINVLSDVFFVRRSSFNNILSSYLTWNTPYWIKFLPGKLEFLRLMKIEPWYKYRVYEENYVRSEVGRFELLNGSLRSVIELGKRLNIPFSGLQKQVVRGIYKSLRVYPSPIFNEKRSSNKNLKKAILSTINAYYGNDLKNPYLLSLSRFYNRWPSERRIHLVFNSSQKFLGRDARYFFYILKDGTLDTFYQQLLDEAAEGFGIVVVSNQEEKEKVEGALKFLNLLATVKINNKI